MVNPVPHSHDTAPAGSTQGRVGLVWVAGLLVAAGAGIATAHGLYEVAVAAGVPRVLAWLYPLITDGLALIAYVTTTRLGEHGRRYAWSVVVVAAGLSGLTQAGYLTGGVATAPPVLRFAIGAWPALAAAIVAHLLYLLGARHATGPATATAPTVTALGAASPTGAEVTPVAIPQPGLASAAGGVLPPGAGVQGDRSQSEPHTPTSPSPRGPVVRKLYSGLNTVPGVEQAVVHPPETHGGRTGRGSSAPAAARAVAVAREHEARHGRLPTVTELATLARVARGTAASALKDLRGHQSPRAETGKTRQRRQEPH